MQRLVDPSWVLTHDLDVTGPTVANARPALVVRAVARPNRVRSGSPQDLAAERELIVDAERGFLHRDIALFDGVAYDVMEWTELTLDPPLDDATFAIDIPAGFEVIDGRDQERQFLHRPPSRRWWQRA